MGPLPISKAGAIEGKNYFIDVNSGALVPYEFTTNGGSDPSKYPDFVQALLEAVRESDALRVFGPVAKPQQLAEPYTELEVPELRSTVMVPARMVPVNVDNFETTIYTNWVLSYPKPEPADGCIKTRSNKHHPMDCRKTRNRSRWGVQRPAVGDGGSAVLLCYYDYMIAITISAQRGRLRRIIVRIAFIH